MNQVEYDKVALLFRSQVVVCGKLFQRFDVDNSLLVLNAGRFASAILRFRISRAPKRLSLKGFPLFAHSWYPIYRVKSREILL